VAEKVRADHVLDMLDHHMRVACRGMRPIREAGWAYILWSSTERDILALGATAGTLEDAISRLEDENPDRNPYGVLAAWLVHDPDAASDMIEKRFRAEAVGEGFYRMDLLGAKTGIAEGLKTDENLSHSPWHSDQPLPEASVVADSAAPFLKIR
jgi:hypothetical protein